MVDVGEFSGRTVEDAISQAVAQLGVPRDDLEIVVITPGRGGVFGIGAENARIRAEVKNAPPVVMEPEPAPEPEPEVLTSTEPEHIIEAQMPEQTPVAVEEHPEPEEAAETPVAQAAKPADAEHLPEDAARVLGELLAAMGFRDVEVHIRTRENPTMIAITGNNLGVLIGRRGDNLSALQFMVNLILSKHRRQWPRVVVDVENYRARREESLTQLADRIAYRVRRNGRPFTLEAMPASDRRVIHLSLRDRSDVETYSIGEGSSRRVVVAPKRPEGADDNRDSYYR